MGMFLQIAAWQGWAPEHTKALLQALTENGNPFTVRPEDCVIQRCPKGTAVLFNDGCVGYEGLAEALSRRVDGPVLLGSIYDGDFWDYFLYQSGAELDRFTTMPDYFEDPTPEELRRWTGRAGRLAAALACSPEDLAPYLVFWTEDNEGEFARPGDQFDRGDPMQLFDFFAAAGFTTPLEEVPESWQQTPPAPQAPLQPAPPPVPPQPLSIGDWEAQAYGDLSETLCVDAERIDQVQVRRGGEWRASAKGGLSAGALSQHITDTLATPDTSLAVAFLLQGEGTYVKRLKKKVYRPFRSTLVLHHGADNFALLFFAGDSKKVHLLIGDFFTYMEVDSNYVRDLPVGEARLPEYGIHQDCARLEKALRWLLQSLDDADRRLTDSKLWSSTNYFAGEAGFQKYRRLWGLLDGETTL